MIVTDDRVAGFVGARVGRFIYPPWTAMGIERSGEIIAGAVFNCFTGPNVEVTVAGKGWTPGFMRAVGRYVFGQLGCLRITVTTEQPEVERIALRCGGEVEGKMRDFYGPGRDATVIGILARDYRWK